MTDNNAYVSEEILSTTGEKSISLDTYPQDFETQPSGTKSDDTEVAKLPSDTLESEETEAEIRNQKIRDKDPIFFCRWITTYPKSFFGKYQILKKNIRFYVDIY